MLRAFGRARRGLLARLLGGADADRQHGEQHDPPDDEVDRGRESERHRLRLLEFNQRPAKILGVQEQHRLAVRADLGFALPQHARALRDEPVARGDDVRDLVAEMMNSAIGVPLQKPGDRRALAERAEQLDLGVGKLDENGGHAVFGLIHRLGHSRAKRVAIDLRCRREVGHGDGDVVQAADHFINSVRGVTLRQAYNIVTRTEHMGFLPQAWFTATRTLRRTASLTSAWSFRFGRGMLSIVPVTASCTISANGLPCASAGGRPVSAIFGSASTTPFSDSTSDTATEPAKLNLRRSRTWPSSPRVRIVPSR